MLYSGIIMWCLCGARPALTPGATPMRLQRTAPRPGFGFPALPVLQCGIPLFFLGLGFLQLPIHSTSDLGSYLHSLYLWVDLRPSEVGNLLLLWTSPGQVTRGWSKLECKARWPSRHASEEL